jgi:hypothetical protein
MDIDLHDQHLSDLNGRARQPTYHDSAAGLMKA